MAGVVIGRTAGSLLLAEREVNVDDVMVVFSSILSGESWCYCITAQVCIGESSADNKRERHRS
jgi:hypothetical protein